MNPGFMAPCSHRFCLETTAVFPCISNDLSCLEVFFFPCPFLHWWGFVFAFFFFNHYWIFKSLLGKFLSSAATVKIQSNTHESAKFCSSLFFSRFCSHRIIRAVQEKMLWLQTLLPFLCKLPKVTPGLFLAWRWIIQENLIKNPLNHS